MSTDGSGPDVARRPAVRGRTVDDETRCVHWASPLDVVAIRFACCGEFYPCHACHEETAGHAASVWPRSRRDEEAILCGVCSGRLSIASYLEADACPHCGAAFNPGCRLHAHLYFEA